MLDELRAAGLRPGAVIANQVRPQWLPDRSVVAAANGRVDAERIRAGLAAAGLDLPADVIEGLAAETVEHARQVHGESLRARPAGRGPPLAGAAAADRRRRPRLALRAGRVAARPRASGSRRPPGEHRRPARRPGHPRDRLLRLRRGRQDHHVGRDGDPGRGRGPQGRRAHDRPGEAAGPGARAEEPGQRARPRRRRGHRRRAARDDAGHAPHVRRDGGGARRAGPRREDPGQPLLQDDLHVVLRHAGVHGDGEARPARRDRRSGT